MNKIFIEEDIIDEDYSHYLYHRFTRDVEWKMNQNHPYSEYEPRGYEQSLILSENFNSFPIYTQNHMSHKIIDVEKEMTFGDNVSWKFLDVIPILYNFQKSKNFELGNVDCTIICEKPKIKPHAELIKINIQNIINLKKDRISVKATTTERLGFTGREEGIAALATATLIAQ